VTRPLRSEAAFFLSGYLIDQSLSFSAITPHLKLIDTSSFCADIAGLWTTKPVVLTRDLIATTTAIPLT
jgi:hypothetical protein